MAKYKIRSETEDKITLIELGGDGSEIHVDPARGGEPFHDFLDDDGVAELSAEDLAFWAHGTFSEEPIEFDGSGESEEE